MGVIGEGVYVWVVFLGLASLGLASLVVDLEGVAVFACEGVF